MTRLTTTAALALVDLVGTRVRVIDHRVPELIGLVGVVDDVEWEGADQAPVFLVEVPGVVPGTTDRYDCEAGGLEVLP